MIKLGAGSTFASARRLVRANAEALHSARRRRQQMPKIRTQSNPTFNRGRSVSCGRPTPKRASRLTSQEFVDLLGTKSAAMLGLNWAEIAKTLTLDPSGEIANALVQARDVQRHRDGPGRSRNSTSRSRSKCRACRCSTASAVSADFAVSASAATWTGSRILRQPEARAEPGRAQRTSQSAGVPGGAGAAPVAPALSPKEHVAFQELARELSERLRKTSGKSSASVPVEFLRARCGPSRGAADAEAGTRRAGRPNDLRAPSDRHFDLSAQQPDLRKSRLPRLDRLFDSG